MSNSLIVLCIILGYLLGSIPSGFLIARLYGVDIQKVGSGNIGATNVLRAVGIFPAVLVVLMDPFKGAMAVMIARWLEVGHWGIALAGFAAVLGNNFNIFLRLRGGKGIATSLGVFLAVEPGIALLSTLLGLFTITLGRFVSLGSLVGMVSAPLMLLARGWFPVPYFGLSIAIALLATYRHRENIQRLAKGVERRLGEKLTDQT